MKFIDALPAFLEGKKIYKKSIDKSDPNRIRIICDGNIFLREELIATDWEIVEEPKVPREFWVCGMDCCTKFHEKPDLPGYIRVREVLDE